MRLDRLILKDFLTYESLDYRFENKPLLVQGLNLTDDGQTTNGTGKSGMQTGIEYCITASNSRDVRDNEIISYGKKKANAQLFASCDVRKETIHIDWDIKISGSNVLRLKKKKYTDVWTDDDSQNVSFSNVNDGKKYIMDWFAICKEDLFSYYLINNTRFKSFFKSSNTEKVALVNRFSDASIVEGLDKIDTKELELKIKLEQTKIDETNGKIDFVNSQLEKEKYRDFNKEFQERLDEIDLEIEDNEEEVLSLVEKKKNVNVDISEVVLKIKDIEKLISTMDSEKEPILQNKKVEEEKLKEIQKEVLSAEASISNFKATDFNEKRSTLKESIKDKKGSLKQLNETKEILDEKRNKIYILLNNISVKLSGAIECPKCNHKFLLGKQSLPELEEKQKGAEALKLKVNDLDNGNMLLITDVKKSIEDLELSVSKINAEESKELDIKSDLQNTLRSVNKKVDSINSQISGYDSLLLSIDNKNKERLLKIGELKNTIESHKNKITSIENQISECHDEIESLKQMKASLKTGDNKEVIVSLESDLVDLNKLISSHRIELANKTEELYEVNQWIQNFKQFRMYLANQSLEIIEYHCNRYLKEIGSDLFVTMEGFKVKADGSIKEEINAIITRDVERTFSSFSGGERARLLFASILANRFMINESHPYGGLDFLMIDETLEGLDASGFIGLIDAVKVLDIPVMIVTHVTIENQDDSILTIVKEKGVSFIKK